MVIEARHRVPPSHAHAACIQGYWSWQHLLVREALVAHEAAEVAAVRYKASHANAHVVINLEELSLKFAQLCRGPLHGRQHNVRLALANDQHYV